LLKEPRALDEEAWVRAVVIRSRWTLLLVTVFLGAWWGYAKAYKGLTDWVVFEVGARTLVHYNGLTLYGGNPLHLYTENGNIQIGPPPLLMVAAAESLGPHTIQKLFVTLMALMGVVSLISVESAARHIVGEAWTARHQWIFFAGALPVALAWGFDSGGWKHLDDELALTLVAVASYLIAKRRLWWVIGLFLGTAVAAKPWAVILVPILCGIPRQERAKSTLLMLVIAAAWWAPFMIASPGTVQALGPFQIEVRDGSVLQLLGLHGEVQQWLRPTQVLVGLAVAFLVVKRRGWSAAPLAAMTIRVATDPYVFAYYGLGPIVFALLADATRPSRRRAPVFVVSTLIAEYALPEMGLHHRGLGAARLLWAVGVLVTLLRKPKSQDHTQPHPVEAGALALA
jgi:hypothetical protein